MGAERGQREGVFHQHQQNVVNRKVFSIESPFSWTFWPIKQRFPTIQPFLQQGRKSYEPLTRHYRKGCGKRRLFDQPIDGKRDLFAQKMPETMTRMETAR
ncbi:MAG: hypothetical protein UCH28_01550 [Adlercreutzia sp.]|nr:hypothetical protein [Adlercreutzia sp.]